MGRQEQTIVEILLIGEREKQTVLHLTVVYDAMQFLPGFLHSRSVGRVNYEDQTLGA